MDGRSSGGRFCMVSGMRKRGEAKQDEEYFRKVEAKIILWQGQKVDHIEPSPTPTPKYEPGERNQRKRGSETLAELS